MQQTQLTIRIDQTLKEQAQNLAQHFGLSLSSLIKAFLTNTIQTKTLSLAQDNKNFDAIIMQACQDKKVASKLEKLVDTVIKKYPISL
ncbi:MAG: DUF6364 family protein [Patescibacteria group bacterium]|nr:type II toxin-antitoxin system RelB/DinJ family antitoxin [Patescibacteria group bacterium]